MSTKMFQSGSINKTHILNHSLLRSLADCPLTCPENSCLVGCECRSEDCPKDFTIILIVVTAVVIGVILISVGCYLYLKEKKETRLTGLQVVQIPRAARRELDSSTVHLREDPLDLPVLNNAPIEDACVNAQVGVPINIPGSVSSKIEDSSTIAIANNPQADSEPEDCESDKQNNISVLKGMTQMNEDHSSSNIIIHKTPLNQLDNFEVIGDKQEEEEENLPEEP